MPGSVFLITLAAAAALILLPVGAHLRDNKPAVHAQDAREEASFSEVGDAVHQVTIDADGLYYFRGSTGGQEIRFIVDSGANTTILTKADARNLGIDLRALHYSERVVTANGGAPLAFVRVAKLTVAGMTFRNVRIAVFGREGGASLLGQDLLCRYRRFAIEDGVMTLV